MLAKSSGHKRRSRHGAAFALTGLLCMTLFLAVAAPRHAASQQALNIAAVVNDDVISVYDLSQRIQLVITFSNLPSTPQTQQRIASDVLRRLILEKLRLQEAKRLEIEVPDEAINDAVSRMERQRQLAPGQLTQMLDQRGIDPETLRQQMRAELAWVEVVRTLFRRLVSVSEQEIDDVIAKMQEDAGKPEYLVSEIFLAYDEKSRNEVQQVAQRIYSQLGAGASWPQMAENFSESASALQGGDVGWNLAADLGPILGNVVSQLEPGQFSSPVATDDGVYLLMVRDRRVAKGIEAEPEDVSVGIQRLHLSIPQNADPQTVAQITTEARQLAASAKSCQALDRITSARGDDQSGFLGEFKMSQLNPQFKQLVENLGEGEVSQPFRTPDGVIVLMVCSRSSEGGDDPVAAARQDIERRLLNRRLSRMANQHEEKLRRQAFIDIRL